MQVLFCFFAFILLFFLNKTENPGICGINSGKSEMGDGKWEMGNGRWKLLSHRDLR